MEAKIDQAKAVLVKELNIQVVEDIDANGENSGLLNMMIEKEIREVEEEEYDDE